MILHRKNDLPGEHPVFRRSARALWVMFGVIGTTVVASWMLEARAEKLATQAARVVVAPVEHKIDAHLAEMSGRREVMERYVNEEREARKAIQRKLDALCRASSRPQVCLGGE